MAGARLAARPKEKKGQEKWRSSGGGGGRGDPGGGGAPSEGVAVNNNEQGFLKKPRLMPTATFVSYAPCALVSRGRRAARSAAFVSHAPRDELRRPRSGAALPAPPLCSAAALQRSPS